MCARYGRDTAGALVIAEEFPGARPGSAVLYADGQLAQELLELGDHPLGVHDDSELSIAGLQDKLLLVATEDGWARPVGGSPSTHILKVDDRRHRGLINAEAACLRLARELGITSVEVEETTLADQACLIVSRFDRRVDAHGIVTRTHQEDVGQALACDPVGPSGRGKYESGGGPTLRRVAGLLDSDATDPLGQLDLLVAIVTFTISDPQR